MTTSSILCIALGAYALLCLAGVVHVVRVLLGEWRRSSASGRRE